ncbi:MAG: hypothetical protein K1X74_01375 [Pirellulales bacterium]|nr:hypothetical protein [Pirellulales bacterium]
MATILFLHGLEARPGGFKPQFLASQGFEVLNPALPDESFADAVAVAQQEFDLQRPSVVVGSSRGAAVAMQLDLGPAAAQGKRAPAGPQPQILSLHTPLVLIAPAWRWCGVDPLIGPRSVVLHSEHDELIPLADSRELIAASGLPATALRVVGENHRMNDEAALAALAGAIREFLPRR